MNFEDADARKGWVQLTPTPCPSGYYAEMVSLPVREQTCGISKTVG